MADIDAMSRYQTTTRRTNREREERSLLRSIAGEDRAALTELYESYQARLFKFVYRLTRSYSTSEELVNDIMLAIWRNAGKFRGDSKPSTGFPTPTRESWSRRTGYGTG